MKLPAFFPLLLALVPTLALAAPPADPKLVDLFSRMDEFHAARGVKKPGKPRELKRAPSPEIEKLVNAFMNAHPNTGLLVLKGDTVLAERYQYGRNAQNRFDSASVAKTVLGMLIGFALDEKKIRSLDDRAEQYVPELKGHAYGETSIRDLLTMSSGIAFTEADLSTRSEGRRLIDNTLFQKTEGGVDAVKEFDRREAPAGTRFNYASADTEVLGLVLAKATGQPVATYLSEKIWQPMGAEANATWLVDKGGYEATYCCLNATLRDFARFGMLLASYGVRDGKQIIPAGWVKAATTASAPHLAVGAATKYNGYGYQTWILGDGRPRGNAIHGGGAPAVTLAESTMFGAFGLRGQAIFVDGASKLVVVHTAVWPDGSDQAERAAQFELWFTLLAKTS
ncbi:MAG TPA: serine hydrolase, partial [Burkholderiales bacterium]